MKASDRIVAAMPQMERAGRALDRLEETGVLGLSLAHRTSLALKSVQVRKGFGLRTRSDHLSCGEIEVSIERLRQACESLLSHDPEWAQNALKESAPHPALVDVSGSVDLTQQVS
jgi:hypothetical protein